MIEPGWKLTMRLLRWIALVAGLTTLFAPIGVLAQPMMGGMPAMGAGGPTEVGVVTAAQQSVPYASTLPGRIAASKTAEIRPQVSGIIKSVDFQEGSEVSAGDLLYEIGAGSYEANLALAKANLERAKVTASGAAATVGRYEKLVGSGVTQTNLDDAKLSLLQANADVAATEASVSSAQINLDLTRITAPISGAIGLSLVNQGALVTANQSNALVTIRQLDPAYINLVDSSANLLELRKRMSGGTLPGNGGISTKVRLILEDGTEYDQTGTITEAEIAVSETTGTIQVRATIANPQRLLMPGMFVRAIVEMGEETAFLVPQRAVTFNSDGKATVLVVSAENKAETHELATSRSYNNAWVVTAGLEAGDQIIIDGLQKISEGSEVSPLPVEIDDNGVILQTISANDGAAPEGAMPPAGMPQGSAP